MVVLRKLHKALFMKFLLFAFTILVAACEKSAEPEAPQTSSIEPKKFNYLALGDSYTVGTAIGQQNAYPFLLKNELEANDSIGTVSVDVIAKNGWTTSNLQQGILAEKPSPDYDIVTLLIGVNNQYQGKSKVEYRVEFRKLLEQAIGFGAGDKDRVFVLSVPDWGVTPAADRSRKEEIAMDIDRFNKINKEISDSLGVKYFDITPISRTADNKLELVAKDGLHFSKKMHELWLHIIYADIKKQLLKP